MKGVARLAFVLILSASFQSCRKDCQEAYIDFHVISFTDFETDNIVISRYTKGSNFTLKVESATLLRGTQTYQRNTDTVMLPHPTFPSGNRMTTNFDYEVNVVNAGKIFRITEIIEEQRSEKNDDKSLCLNPVISYKVNNQLVTDVNWDPFYLKK